MSAMGISGFVYDAAKHAVFDSMRERSAHVLCTESNHWAFESWKAYIFSTMALECFINESVEMNSHRYRHSCFPVDEIMDLSIRQKYLLVPSLMGTGTFDKGAQPYQDFETLVRIRNDLIHYRMNIRANGKLKSYLTWLIDRKLSVYSELSDGALSLPQVAFTFRGAQWAYNTCCAMTKTFLSFFDDKFFSIWSSEGPPQPPDIEDEYTSLCAQFPAT